MAAWVEGIRRALVLALSQHIKHLLSIIIFNELYYTAWDSTFLHPVHIRGLHSFPTDTTEAFSEYPTTARRTTITIDCAAFTSSPLPRRISLRSLTHPHCSSIRIRRVDRFLLTGDYIDVHENKHSLGPVSVLTTVQATRMMGMADNLNQWNPGSYVVY